MYSNNDDTIIAIASGPEGAIAIIRMSGPDSFKISSKIMYPNLAFKKPKPNQAYLVKIKDEKLNTIDQAMVLTYVAPKSYTSQDMVEIFCHNSPYIVKKIMELAIRNGARQAKNGEFSFRAFINGKIDLSQAEAVNELIKAETEKEHRIIMNNLEGKLREKVEDIRKNLIDLLAEIEVRVDDNYEELDDLDSEKYYTKIEKVEKEVLLLSKAFQQSNYIKNGIKIAIVGVPNSGKSSLMNKLMGYERAITSPIPGTTRDTIEEKIELNGFKITFIDTAGIRENVENEIELEGIKRTKEAIKKANIVIFLKDITTPLTEGEKICEKIISENISLNTKLIYVYSKGDLSPKRPVEKDSLIISSLTGKNIDKLIDLITREKEVVIDDTYEEISISERHYQCLLNAAKEINLSKSFIKGMQYEIIAEHIRSALSELEEITGKTISEDILESIFSNFCVGK
ncbi:MAG: tRNA uridine-5-carboxymethylaminomethyl(34) synthesis GTPase MnmE [Elusimicrobiota bacterium]